MASRNSSWASSMRNGRSSSAKVLPGTAAAAVFTLVGGDLGRTTGLRIPVDAEGRGRVPAVSGGTAGSFAAVDLGASSGRVVVGRVGPSTLELTEVHRFAQRACGATRRTALGRASLYHGSFSDCGVQAGRRRCAQCQRGLVGRRFPGCSTRRTARRQPVPLPRSAQRRRRREYRARPAGAPL